MPLLKLFLAGNSSGIPGFPGIFRFRYGKLPSKAEEFPARKNLIGVTSQVSRNSLRFLTVHILSPPPYPLLFTLSAKFDAHMW